MDNFFTSDLHLGHWNIVRYCNRPFKTLEDHDKTLLMLINSRVKENDTLYHLGDFCFKKSSEASNSHKNAFEYYREQINCKNIIFCDGNHDGRNGVKTIIQNMMISHGGQKIFMTHDPKYVPKQFPLAFCGHIHQNWAFMKTATGIIVNVGVDVWNFMPVTINDIFSGLEKWKKHEIK